MNRHYDQELVLPGRRRLLKGASGATAAIAMPGLLGLPRLTLAQSTAGASDIVMRTIPKTGERVPVIGLGSFLTFDVLPGQRRDHIREVLRRHWEGGGRVVDTSPLYGTGEISIGDFASAMSINDRLFVANKTWATGEHLWDESHARRSLQRSLDRLWRERIDLMQCHSLVNIDTVLPMLAAWKKEGRIRYFGFSHHENAYHDVMASWIDRGSPDFVQINYSIANRSAEAKILPAALEKGVGVFVNMPFEKARLFKVVEGQPLPAFAKELGVENWAQYFLKWVASHPAVTCVIPATSNPDHAAQNIAALRGPLPDRAMRERMLRQVQSIPGHERALQMPWYPDKRYAGIINRSQAELRART